MRQFERLTCLTTLIFFTFMYVPILVVGIYSFNVGRSAVTWEGFSLVWYQRLFEDQQTMSALLNSLIVTSISTVIATILGTLVAIGISRYDFCGKRLLSLLMQLPIFLPDIVLGIATLSLLVLVDFTLGIRSLVLAHVTFCSAFIALVVTARLANFPSYLELAAKDLGASSIQVFRYVTLPLILPGILSGALLSFAMSFDDFTISFFVSGVGSTTLPVRIFSMLHFGVSPAINALSTLLVTLSFSLVYFASRFQRKIL